MPRRERVYLVPSNFWRSVSEETHFQSYDLFGYKVVHHLDDETSSLLALIVRSGAYSRWRGSQFSDMMEAFPVPRAKASV